MTKRGPDHQKREAKQSLWDLDGHHAPKRYRNKGKGRGKDKRLVQRQYDELQEQAELDQQDAWDQELREAWDCYMFGPCARCKRADNEGLD